MAALKMKMSYLLMVTSVIDLRQYLYEMVCVNMPMQTRFSVKMQIQNHAMRCSEIVGLHSDNDKLDSAFDLFGNRFL